VFADVQTGHGKTSTPDAGRQSHDPPETRVCMIAAVDYAGAPGLISDENSAQLAS